MNGKKEKAREEGLGSGQEANAGKSLNEQVRREKVEELARTLREQSSAVFEAQMALLEGPTSEDQLDAAKRLLSKPDYDDVISERFIAGVCGHPLCDNMLPELSAKKGRYRISLAQKRVFDTSETVQFCCLDHVVKSKGFRASLGDERPLLPTGEELQAFVDAVKGLAKRELKPTKSSEAGNVTLPAEGSSASPRVMRPTLVERVFTSIEDAAFQPPKVGDAGAIEGYVPRTAAKKPASKDKKVSFASTNQPIAAAGNSSNLAKESKASASKGSVLRKEMERVTGDQSKPQNQRSEDSQEKLDEGADLRAERQGLDSQKSDVHWSRKLDESAAEAGISVARYTEGGKERHVSEAESSKKDSAGVESREATAMETSFSGQEGKSTGQTGIADRVRKGVKASPLGTLSEVEQRQTNVESDLRLQSAQAVATALAEAAARVQSGELNESEAMQSLGMTVQPANEKLPRVSRATITEISELERDEETGEEKAESGRVRKGLALKEISEKVPSEDSNGESSSRLGITADANEDENGQGWMDSPPKGFTTELSTFGTLWIALESWISAETLRFLGGTDSKAEASTSGRAGGRECGPRVVLENGVSAQISKGFQENIARALPEVQRALQLKMSRPHLEEALGNLSRTFSFTAPLPSLKSSGWRLVTLLLLRALAIRNVPSLKAYFEDGGRLEKAFGSYGSSQSEFSILLEKIVPEGLL